MKKVILVVAVALVAGGVFAAAESQAQMQKEAKISMKHARTIALGRVHHGKIESAELEREHGILIYSFDIERNNKVHEVNVDANTGKIVEDTVESAAAEAHEQRREKKPTTKHLP